MQPLALRRSALPALLLLAAACSSRVVRTPPPVSPNAAVTAPFTKSLSFSVLEDYDKGEDLEGVRNDFRLMHELGVATWRGSFGWDDYEPERGEYDFEWLHAFAEVAAQERIALRPYIGYTPEWAAIGRLDDDAYWNDPPSDIASWTAFVGALAREMRRHSNIVSYEIYNEENTRVWWDGTPAEYFQVLASASAAIRAAHPGAQVLMGGIVWPDVEWVDQICGEFGGGGLFDVLPFHAYPETWTPDSVTVERYLDAQYHDAFIPTADSLCGEKPIWINELGFATIPGTTERDQANWWARAIATYAADRRVAHLGIYEIRDLPRDSPVIGDDPNYHLGLVHTDGTRKLAFATVQLLVALLGVDSLTVADAELEVRLSSRRERELYHHLFVRPDGRQVLVLWDRLGSPVVDVRIRRAASAARLYDLDGRSTELEVRGGWIRRLRLSPGEVRIIVADP